jgi:hypothetical protein
MILLSLGLFAFGISDLVRGPPEQANGGDAKRFPSSRELLGVVAGAGGAGTIAALADSPLTMVAGVAAAAFVVLWIWVVLDRQPPGGHPLIPLAWVAGVLVALFSISSLGDEIRGPLRDWYTGLDFAFISHVKADQFVLACGASLFALASCNRVVVLVLGLAATSLKEEDSSLKGGRLLGPMERIIVGAAILAGEPAAAAIVIAAKGVLRFPEIQRERASAAGRLSADANTEYFLIGTLSSLLLAGALAVCVSGSG